MKRCLAMITQLFKKIVFSILPVRVSAKMDIYNPSSVWNKGLGAYRSGRHFVVVTVAILIVLFLSTSLIMLSIYKYFSDIQRQGLKTDTAMVSQGIFHERMDYMKNLDFGKYRVTWIGSDGTVLYDNGSNAEALENHIEREEVQQALLYGYGESQRYSSTMLEKMLYSAQRLPDGTVVRLSISQQTILMLILDMAVPIAGIIILLLLAVVYISYRETKHANEADTEAMRREFTANVSHELKSPLHAIAGYAELLKEGMAGKDDVQGFAEKIYVEAQRMIRLVQDILILSRLDEGKGNTKKTTVNLYQLSQTVCCDLQSLAKEKDVTLELIGKETCVKGIAPLLYSMIYNICENGIKYNRPGGNVVVSVGIINKAPQISIRDSGIGISRGDQKRIFERFYRVDKSHSREVGGTGLGLSIVKHAAKLNNAKIWIESIIDEGTIITVTF